MNKTPCSLKSRRNVILAFAILYIVWGSTYLAIKLAIDTFPPLLMASLRFVSAGLLAYCLLPASQRQSATPKQWRSATIIGFLLLTIGNGAIVLSEKWIPTGMVSLLVAITPMLIAVIETFPKFQIAPRTLAGLLIGTAGIAFLINPSTLGIEDMNLFPLAILLAGSFSWAAGSIYSRSVEKPKSMMMFLSMQMLTGGLMLGLMSLVTGELSAFDPLKVSLTSVLALTYLIVFGALIGYGAYIWLLQNVSPTKVSTYAYVNPIIAVLLGCLFAGERVGPQTIAAGVLILGAVWLINSKSKSVKIAAAEDSPAPIPVPVAAEALSPAIDKSLAITRGHMKG